MKLEFIKDNSNIEDIEELRKYQFSGYCVMNAVNHVLNGNGQNTNLLNVQRYAKMVCKMFFDGTEEGKNAYKTMINELYELGIEDARAYHNNIDYAYAKNMEFYNKKRYEDCMNGNYFWMGYAILKYKGYTIKNINCLMDDYDLNYYYEKYGNFYMSVRGHASSVVNGKIVDFFNPFTKNVLSRKDDGRYEYKETSMRKKVHYIIYKTR